MQKRKKIEMKTHNWFFFFCYFLVMFFCEFFCFKCLQNILNKRWGNKMFILFFWNSLEALWTTWLWIARCLKLLFFKNWIISDLIFLIILYIFYCLISKSIFKTFCCSFWSYFTPPVYIHFQYITEYRNLFWQNMSFNHATLSGTIVCAMVNQLHLLLIYSMILIYP